MESRHSYTVKRRASEDLGSTMLPLKRTHSQEYNTSSSLRCNNGDWLKIEDEILREAVLHHGVNDWGNVSSHLRKYFRESEDCKRRWDVIKTTTIKGPWTREEDRLLESMVDFFGTKKWSLISQNIPGRVGKQCRERWRNHLAPTVCKDPWSDEEDTVLMNAQKQMGNRWSEIAKLLPGRAENAVKNRYNSMLNKRWNDENKAADDEPMTGLIDPMHPILVSPSNSISGEEAKIISSEDQKMLQSILGGKGNVLCESQSISSNKQYLSSKQNPPAMLPEPSTSPRIRNIRRSNSEKNELKSSWEFRERWGLKKSFNPVPFNKRELTPASTQAALAQELLQLSISPSRFVSSRHAFLDNN